MSSYQYCVSCGSKNELSYSYCPKCGQNLKSFESSTKLKPVNKTKDFEPMEIKKNQKFKSKAKTEDNDEDYNPIDDEDYQVPDIGGQLEYEIRGFPNQSQAKETIGQVYEEGRKLGAPPVIEKRNPGKEESAEEILNPKFPKSID